MKTLAGIYCGAVVLFLLTPVLVLIPMSFGSAYIPEFPPKSFSLDQYRQFLQSEDWLGSVATSLRVGLARRAGPA